MSDLDGRTREHGGEIHHKNHSTHIHTLRETYGKHFAPGYDDHTTLGELLEKEKFESLSQYVKHHGHHEA
ncbi:hypothetical protein GOB94_06460 [Granulicella sp. 5B5]|uniref:hypothetical protein n=1 Tax=Granulicella sp. 5B5 TaxID=1617967 RepID=UPI0015F441E8|nr:hypothetical protein [Granulicella sp. 5B5]QMV18365.1 hypothetical protein GOB94_06460 [Granulicella sp. 5B5]